MSARAARSRRAPSTWPDHSLSPGSQPKKPCRPTVSVDWQEFTGQAERGSDADDRERGSDAEDRDGAEGEWSGGDPSQDHRAPTALVASSPLSPVVARPEMSTGSSTKYLAKFVVAAGRRSCHTGTGVDQLVASRRRSSSMPSDPIGVWLFTTCERQAFPPTTNITPLAACAQDPQAATAAPSRTTAASPPRRDLPLAMIQPRRLSCRAHVPVAWTHPLCLSQAA